MSTKDFKNFILVNKYILGIIILGLILRVYNFKELYMLGHDQDLQGWFIKDVLVNKHLRLIGQETSTQGIFIGPLFYYLLIPFYLLSKMDPIGGVFLTVILGLFAIWSMYFVMSKIFDIRSGIIASFVYSISFYTVFNDREVVPTMPVILWTVWYLFALHQIIKGDFIKGLILSGFLIGLVWHLNFGLVVILPLLILAVLFSGKRLRIKEILLGCLAGLPGILPLMLFEFRHGFSQSKYFIESITTNQHDIVSGADKIRRTFHLLSKNLAGVIWGDYFELSYEYIFYVFIALFAILVYKRKINNKISVIMGLWIFTYLAFFSFYSKIVSEYYLNGAIVVFVAVISKGISELLKVKKNQDFARAFLVLFAVVNIDRFITIPLNRSGYLEKNMVLDSIKEDQELMKYPCISVSYITNPGYERGYRYLTWLKKIKTKPISEDVPTYTIVFPLKPIFKTDQTFGAIGLIYPDYGRYNLEKIKSTCEGNDFNTLDSMIGFTN